MTFALMRSVDVLPRRRDAKADMMAVGTLFGYLELRMARENDEFGALLLGAIAGFGIGLAVASNKGDDRAARRARFASRVKSGLRAEGRKLMNASFGRSSDRAPFWKLTVQDASQVRFIRVPLEKNEGPYDDGTADKVLAVVRQKLASSAA